MQEVSNILRILRETKRMIAEDDPHTIKELSNQTIHSATISQDADNIIVAVVIYSIGKIFERKHYQQMNGWNEFKDSTLKNLDSAISSLENNHVDGARNSLGRIRDSLNKISSDLSEYMKDVFRKAEINKAFKLYEHGLSAEQTAKLLGVSLWDMASYIGQSSISNAKASITLPVKKRVEMAEEFFG